MTEETTQTEATVFLNINLNINEINTILAGLQELPFKVADPLLKNIIAQAQGQLAQQAEQAPAEVEV